jgi:thiosulfate/3-mercaptopyruvate sulfurtransferase
MTTATLLEATEFLARDPAIPTVVFDCRFSLAEPEQGRVQYLAGHIPGAHYLDLNRDLAGPVGVHGGRHPLPAPARFATMLADYGVGPDTDVVAYDDSRLAGAARLWWLMRSMGYQPPGVLNGGYQAFLAAGGKPELSVPEARPCAAIPRGDFSGHCDIDGLRSAQQRGALLVDAREERRYQGLEEPIDPVAGHIPGAINQPWIGMTTADGYLLATEDLQARWGETLEAAELVVYCGSGVTACVDLFALARLGREDAALYAGSWSDWCTYL